MVDEYYAAGSWSSWMIGAIKNVFVTTIALLVWLFATIIALSLISALTGIWYVFFYTPVFGDFLGFIGTTAPAAPATTSTLVFIGAMALFAIAGCYMVYRSLKRWRRNILQKRRQWLGLG